jgi:hypothetical protein
MTKLRAVPSKYKKKKQASFELGDIKAAESEHIIYLSLCGLESPLFTLNGIRGFLKDHPYRVFFDPQQTPVILGSKDDGSWEITSIDTVSSDVFHQYNSLQMTYPGLPAVSLHNVSRGVKAFLHQRANQINKNIMTEWPKAIAFKSEEKACFRKLDYDPQPCTLEELEEKAPIFNSFLKRSTNNEALLLKIASAFRDRCLKQSLYIHGVGNSGKSTLMSAIAKALGGESNTLFVNSSFCKGRFWKSSLISRSIVVVEEADLGGMLADEWKSITGSKNHSVEFKGRDPITVTISGHWFFLSNHPIKHDDDALLARLIPITVSKLDNNKIKSTDNILKGLDKEIPYFIGYCLNLWDEKGGDDMPWIKFDEEELKNAKEDSEFYVRSIFESHFAWDSEAIKAADCRVTTTMVLQASGDLSGKGKGAAALKDFLIKKGCKVVTKRVGKRTIRYFTGIRKLSSYEMME